MSHMRKHKTFKEWLEAKNCKEMNESLRNKLGAMVLAGASLLPAVGHSQTTEPQAVKKKYGEPKPVKELSKQQRLRKQREDEENAPERRRILKETDYFRETRRKAMWNAALSTEAHRLFPERVNSKTNIELFESVLKLKTIKEHDEWIEKLSIIPPGTDPRKARSREYLNSFEYLYRWHVRRIVEASKDHFPFDH